MTTPMDKWDARPRTAIRPGQLYQLHKPLSVGEIPAMILVLKEGMSLDMGSGKTRWLVWELDLNRRIYYLASRIHGAYELIEEAD